MAPSVSSLERSSFTAARAASAALSYPLNPALASDGEKLRDAWKSWLMAMVIAHFAALVAILVLRRLQGNVFSGWWRSRSAWGAGFVAGAAVLVANRRRVNLQRLRNTSFETLLYATFDKRTASFFSRLPETFQKLQQKLGEIESGETRKRDALRNLYELSVDGSRQPYAEAREASQERAVAAATSDLRALRYLAFAEASYEDSEIVRKTCHKYGHDVIFITEVSQPGAPAHFLSFFKERKEAILSIRGTKTLSDVLTDVSQDIDEFELGDGKRAYAHAGFLASAQHVIFCVKPIIRDLLIPQGYSLTITGHSLGAGTAALVTKLLLKDFPGIIRCICFAPPPVIDASTALAAHSITSFVCNDDCVPRISLQNLGRLKLLAAGKKVDELVKDIEMQETDSFQSSIPDLLVPGKVIMLHRLARQPDDANEDRQAKPDEHAAKTCEWQAWTADGSLPELNYVELAPASVTEHMAPVYREAIAVVLARQGALNEVEPRAQEDYPTWLDRATRSGE